MIEIATLLSFAIDIGLSTLLFYFQIPLNIDFFLMYIKIAKYGYWNVAFKKDWHNLEIAGLKE